MNTLNFDTWEWYEDVDIEVPEEHDMQELLCHLPCPQCTGDMAHHDYKAYGVCVICHSVIKE